MTQISENSQWYTGKTKTILQYSGETRKLFSAVAGRGFVLPPGFLYEAQTEVELAAKLQLSELNFKILQETIEREIKQAGIDYDIQFRDAQVQWELDKQTLLDAWSREYAGVKLDMDLQEEALNQLAVEVSSRGTLLLEAKTAIELQMESYRLQIEELGDDAADYEVALAQQRLITAGKKANVIPILERILRKEEELIQKESEKIDAFSDLVEIEKQIANKKERELLPAMAEYATRAEQVAAETVIQVGIETDISAQKVELAEIDIEKTKEEVKVKKKEMAIQNTTTEKVEKAIDLDAEKNNARLELTELDTAHTREVKDTSVAAHEEIIAKDIETASLLNSYRTEEAQVKIDSKVESAKTLYGSEEDKIKNIADIQADENKEVAYIQAAPMVTSLLRHLLENA